mgnify:CR=1 FL=1
MGATLQTATGAHFKPVGATEFQQRFLEKPSRVVMHSWQGPDTLHGFFRRAR